MTGKNDAPGRNLNFEGVRLGKFERHPSIGTGSANSPRIPLGSAGPMDVFAHCYSVNGAVRLLVKAERQAGSEATGIVYGSTAPGGWSSLGTAIDLQALDSATVTVQWAATLVLFTGEAWDLRGVSYRQNDANGPFAPGPACGFTPMHVEKISR